MKKVSEQLQREWETLADQHNNQMMSGWISKNLLRPFLFFATQSSTLHQKLQFTNVKCMSTCFKILLQSINSADVDKNFCSLAVGTHEERSTWLYQAQKLISLCSFILAECDSTGHENESIVPLTVLAMRLSISLSDLKAWKSLKSVHIRDADIAVKRLIGFMATRKSGMYSGIRKYIMRLGSQVASRKRTTVSTDDCLVITASAITLALRPFHSKKLDTNDIDIFDVNDACRQYCIFILTVPYLTQCLPSLLLPALKHGSALLRCLNNLLVVADFQG